ncbi:tRNA glutamyl-Q(34) synthetase GluQRS [Nitrococcus mobilis]|uniref:Glutamyl-Q tRNA(Asp) synthetase n=1 Tax=Nitrococcus mobilis Nb-231 TaxID=314278 RepID=A4BM24_9GAMM|nr:tRNA glutamyl-Q(34) synthetase GluQRS [Nitrococcus mobilis]EAR23362.1 glutamyl-tRNA synthetase [Nitrococcus mobilis Nb-231]
MMSWEHINRQTAVRARPSSYIGRFAPSPTGPLHFGSLVAALGSWLDAHAQGGRWAVRIDDLDRPRNVPGADGSILRTLDGFGLWWDGPVAYQSKREEAYRAALVHLQRAGLAFPCGCSRREISRTGRLGPAGYIYPGTCRAGRPIDRPLRSWRMLSRSAPIRFQDRACIGIQEMDLERMVGDFVICRADGLYAYHLASVVDDAALGVTDVVRGGDLLNCAPPQILLQRKLGLPTPRYLHLPVARDTEGKKLSKQTQAPPVHPHRAGAWLHSALAFLRQAPPAELRAAPPGELLGWALRHWRPQRLLNPPAAFWP